ncbi:ATP synthase F1, delta subunit [Cooperia oncophora]
MAQMLKRSFSVSATAFSGLVKAPAQVHGIEGRYASALYSAAYKQKSLEQVDKDLQKIRSIYQQDASFRVSAASFVESPSVAVIFLLRELRSQIPLFSGGQKKNRLLLGNRQQSSAYWLRKSTNFLVTSAEPLTKSHESALNDALNKPSIMGGLVVTIGDKYVDLSIASRVKKLKEVIIASV